MLWHKYTESAAFACTKFSLPGTIPLHNAHLAIHVDCRYVNLWCNSSGITVLDLGLWQFWELPFHNDWRWWMRRNRTVRTFPQMWVDALTFATCWLRCWLVSSWLRGGSQTQSPSQKLVVSSSSKLIFQKGACDDTCMRLRPASSSTAQFGGSRIQTLAVGTSYDHLKPRARVIFSSCWKPS